MSTRKIPPPSLADLRERGTIPPDDLTRMEAYARDLQGIAARVSQLEHVRGYTANGTRHPGIADALQDLLIAHDLTITGFTLPDGSHVSLRPGSHTSVDERLLLSNGVAPEIIVASRRTTNWLSVTVTKPKPDSPEEASE